MAEAPLAVLVLGPHRSGTSCVTELVQALGFALGRDVLGARPDNSRGLWENAGVVAATEALLARAASAWFDPSFLDLEELLPAADAQDALGTVLDDQFGRAAGDLVLKDPRLCRLADSCTRVLRGLGYRVRFVLLLRDPRASADSLHRRDGIPHPVGIALWVSHVLGALRAVRGQVGILVDYDALLAGDGTLAELAAWLRGGEALEPAALRALRDRIVPELRHARARARPEPDDEPLTALAETIFTALRRSGRPLAGAGQLAVWEARFRARVAGPRWLGWGRVVVLHQPADTGLLPAGWPDTLARAGWGLLVIADGDDQVPLARELLEPAATGRLGLFSNLEVRGEAASLARGISLAGAASDLILVRSGALAVIDRVLERCAVLPDPVELVSSEGEPLALSLPAVVARGIDAWAHVAAGDAAWGSMVDTVGARREILARGQG